MYAAYWNLKLKPFLNVMDRRFLFTSSQHEEAIARLQFIAENNRLAGVLTGIYGIGKSTVLKIVASNLETQHRLPVICMDAIPDGYLPMMRTILDAMKVPSAATTLPDALSALQADTALMDGFGPDFVRYYSRVKQSEAQRHALAEDTTDFERREYFSRF